MMKTINSLLLFFFLIQTGIGNSQTNPFEKKIDSLFSGYNSGTPGISVAVVKDGSIVFKKGYGMANLEYGIPNTPQTVFHIASLSKQFTAFAIYLLKQEGRLSLEDDVRKYIPELPVYGKPIRIRHLLAHTSGLRDQWATLTLAGWQMEDIITTDQIIKLASRQKALNFETGTAFGYCNTGYTLLAEIVSRISDQSFAAFTTARIFQPLGMSSTVFYDDFHTVLKNRAHSYELRNKQYAELKLNYSTVGATSLNTTVEDMAKWINNFTTPVVGDAVLLKEFNAISLLDNGQPVIWNAQPNDTIFHAKGQLHMGHKGLKRISHGGHDAGYRSVLIRFPEDGVSIVGLSNDEHFVMGATINPIIDLYLEDKLKEEPAVVSTPPTMAAEKKAFVNVPKDYVGEYYSDELTTNYRVSIKDGKLIMSHYRLGDIELKPTGKDQFSGINSFGFDMLFIRKNQQVAGFEISNFGAKRVKFGRKG